MMPKQQHGGRRPGAGRLPGPPTRVVRLPVPLANLACGLAAAEHMGDVAGFLDVDNRTALRIPMMAWLAACGFPSPAEDYVDRPLDFNELLIEHPAATFAIRIEGDSHPQLRSLPDARAARSRRCLEPRPDHRLFCRARRI